MSYAPPMFECGQVIDLRYARIKGGIKLPDRIQIDMVYRKINSTEWMYHVVSEQANGYSYMTQSKIFTNISEHTAKCYERPDVQKLMKLGYRFISNRDDGDIADLVGMLDAIDEIGEIISVHGILPDGTDAPPAKKGIWIKYKTVVGTYTDDIQYERIK